MIELRFELPLARFGLRVDLDLQHGVTAVMGASGSGKTSLLEVVAGLRKSARGRVVLAGEVLLDTSARRCLAPERRRVGYVPQDAGLFPHLTALGNVRFGARGDQRRIDQAIDTLEIRPCLGRHPSSLSGGERQRVALARALATEPRLLLLDEPLASLDVGLRERILPYLIRIREDWRIPILYVTHNVGEALALADEVLLLAEGRVEAKGPPLALLASPTLAREAEAGIENLWAAAVVAHHDAGGITAMETTAGVPVAVTLVADRAIGSRVTLAVRAEDVLVSLEPLRGASARNTYEARVLSLQRTGPDVTLRCQLAGAAALLARITPQAALALHLAPGDPVFLAIKSHSVRVL
jgi:molybdate transport system ATP-binding protein